ncbi:MAG: hypothetical protein KBT10_00330 [Bacteroidales bacterium]|nr:hypothetical protein [Candidatus Sodaliphilus aphodohippi]
MGRTAFTRNDACKEPPHNGSHNPTPVTAVAIGITQPAVCLAAQFDRFVVIPLSLIGGGEGNAFVFDKSQITVFICYI